MFKYGLVAIKKWSETKNNQSSDNLAHCVYYDFMSLSSCFCVVCCGGITGSFVPLFVVAVVVDTAAHPISSVDDARIQREKVYLLSAARKCSQGASRV